MLKIDNDRDTINRLWNRFVAAWFEKGKEDPKLCLLRFEPSDAQIWLDASSLVTGIKVFLGLGDPKKDYQDALRRSGSSDSDQTIR
jgi:general stress protein 26